MALFTGWYYLLIWGLAATGVAVVIVRLLTNSAVRHEYELERASWERQNGRDFPFAMAELIEHWRARRRVLSLRVTRNLALSGILLIGCWRAFERYSAAEFGVVPGNVSFAGLWQIGGFVILAAAGVFLILAFLQGRRPAVATLLREMEGGLPTS